MTQQEHEDVMHNALGEAALMRLAGRAVEADARLLARRRRGRPVLIKHRGSCCLYSRFGDGRPHYCGKCLFRTPQTSRHAWCPTPNACGLGAEAHDLLSHSEDVKR